jgi:predicted TIM-barrel fold metal-dependent hydrolase
MTPCRGRAGPSLELPSIAVEPVQRRHATASPEAPCVARQARALAALGLGNFEEAYQQVSKIRTTEHPSHLTLDPRVFPKQDGDDALRLFPRFGSSERGAPGGCLDHVRAEGDMTDGRDRYRMAGGAARRQEGLTMARDRIDVHAHYVPETYRDALVAAGQERPDGIPALPEWNQALALDAMDKLDVRLAILSISSPGVHFGDAAAAAALARMVNETGAQIAKSTPQRFGFFAALPLPEIDASVAETRYALDHLGAAGICLMTNHRGMYLGDQRLEPIFAEVAARNSVVFVHPTSPPQPTGGPDLPAPALEFMFETTRSITDLVLAGVPRRHPGLPIIVPHAGAALSVLASRIDLFASALARSGAEVPSLREALNVLHFDLAGAPVEEQLAALLSVADPARLHYGSDFPFTPWQACQYLAQQLETCGQLDDAALDAMFTTNAEGLFRRAATP